MLRTFSFCLTALIVFSISTAVATAEDATNTLRIGTSTALSGPAKPLGIAMVNGMQAHIAEINRQGGVHGRHVELITLDDGYDPASAKRQMLRLIDEFAVLAVLGNVGTPTAKVTVPLANHHHIPLVGAFTGASLLRRQPPDRYIINYRASYNEETAAIVAALIQYGIHPEEIAFFTQKDDFGDAGYQGALKALRDQGYDQGEQLPHGRYPRNTLHVEQGLITLLDSGRKIRAILIVGTHEPAAKFIKLARELFPDAIFFSLSFVGSTALAQSLKEVQSRVFVAQVVPSLDSDLPAVRDFHKAMHTVEQSHLVNYVSLEGYLVARLFTEALRRTGPEVDRERLINTFESFTNVDIGTGAPVTYSANDHQASHRVWLTRIKDGKVLAADWKTLE